MKIFLIASLLGFTAHSQSLILPSVCEFNPDLPFCKKRPICKYELQICEPEEILICEDTRFNSEKKLCLNQR